MTKQETTPMNINDKLSVADGGAKANGEVFRSMVGGLIYLTHTRPDLSYAVNLVARFMQHPSNIHIGAARRILKYVAFSDDMGIWYEKCGETTLMGYSDSDWANCVDDRKSLSTYLSFFGNGAISWSSKKQPMVALSSTEAEYIAVAGASCQAT